MTLVVVDAVGLTPRALQHMPRVSRLGADGFQARLDPIVPAVTCTVQSTFLTGLLPGEHGIVGNGWYFRDLAEVLFWRQSTPAGAAARRSGTPPAGATRRSPAPTSSGGTRCTRADFTVTPRPMYPADGRKLPDSYTQPAELRDELQAALGQFPLFELLGPGADIKSSQWIADAATCSTSDADPHARLPAAPRLRPAAGRARPRVAATDLARSTTSAAS